MPGGPFRSPGLPPTMADPADDFLPASDTAARYRVHVAILARWLRDDALRFPRPMIVRGHRYWRRADLVEWECLRSSPRPDAMALAS